MNASLCVLYPLHTPTKIQKLLDDMVKIRIIGEYSDKKHTLNENCFTRYHWYPLASIWSKDIKILTKLDVSKQNIPLNLMKKVKTFVLAFNHLVNMNIIRHYWNLNVLKTLDSTSWKEFFMNWWHWSLLRRLGDFFLTGYTFQGNCFTTKSLQYQKALQETDWFEF